jgi:uncharacterized protein YbcI
VYRSRPDRARTSIGNDFIVVVLRDALTTSDRSLLGAGQHDLVAEIRRHLHETMSDHLVTVVERLTQREVLTCMWATDVKVDVAAALFVLGLAVDAAERASRYDTCVSKRNIVTVALAVASCSVGAVLASAATPTYYRLPLNDKLVVKPSRIEFKDLELTMVKWNGWGTPTATGRARASSLQCEPNCAAGTRINTTARLRAFKLKTRNRKRIYYCLTGSLAKGEVRRIVWPPGCNR